MALHVMDEANHCLGCKVPRCQQGCRQKAGDQFFHIENSFTSFFFPAPGPTLFLP